MSQFALAILEYTGSFYLILSEQKSYDLLKPDYNILSIGVTLMVLNIGQKVKIRGLKLH
jgi:hypothetical protein